MTHNPIQIKHLSLFFPHKVCFEDFTTQIQYGDRIAIIGRNGSGKSTLLNMLRGAVDVAAGSVYMPPDVVLGYVPQVVEDLTDHSGGQRVNAALTRALANDPTLLLLDEPTNHLDKRNRTSLMRMLQHYAGTLIVVSHDVELLRQNVNMFWHIDQGKIKIFSGNYDDCCDSSRFDWVCRAETIINRHPFFFIV